MSGWQEIGKSAYRKEVSLSGAYEIHWSRDGWRLYFVGGHSSFIASFGTLAAAKAYVDKKIERKT